MKLHEKQALIASDTHRFRVIACGRRFGKTLLASEEIKGKALAGNNRILYIATTYAQARDIMWEGLKRELRPIIKSANESRLELKVHSKQGESTILLRGWESVEALRGQFFHFIVLDEVASMKNFLLKWQEVLLPMLTDTKGEAMFLSTPKGFNHFYDLFNLHEQDADWASFRYTTYDNPHIDNDEIDRLKRQMTENAFAQEYLADFRKAEGLVYKEFFRQLHVMNLPNFLPIETIVGVDFGYVHPAAILTIQRDSADRYYVIAEHVRSGMTDQDVARYVAALPVNAVYADPESRNGIEELRRLNVNVRDVVKGSDSEKNGLDKVRDLLKAHKLFIHPDCHHLIGEFETHSYKDNGEPEDEGEDALDALRYPLMMQQPKPVYIPWQRPAERINRAR